LGQFKKTDLAKVDKAIRAEVKLTLNVPQEAANEYLYGSAARGACGL